MFFNSKTRVCTKCNEHKTLSCYHKDTKGKDGFSARCISCRNGLRKVSTLSKQESPKKEPERASVDPVKIPVVSENILEALSKKFDATLTVTVRRDQKTYLQIHSSPKMAYKFLTPEGLLEIA